jgi:hypothetical protein
MGMKYLNLLVYEAIAVASAVAILTGYAVGRNKTKNKNRNVRGRCQRRRMQEKSVGSPVCCLVKGRSDDNLKSGSESLPSDFDG